MDTLIKFSVVLLAFGFFNCGNSKQVNSEIVFVQNPPFNLINSYYQDWVAGVQNGGSGTNIHLRFQTMDPKVQLKDVYFQKRSAPLERKMTSAITYVGYIMKENNREDIVMDSNSNKEAANTPPKKLPFEIDDTDAVISYTFNDKLHYFKIENIERKEMLAYPSAPPNRDN